MSGSYVARAVDLDLGLLALDPLGRLLPRALLPRDLLLTLRERRSSLVGHRHAPAGRRPRRRRTRILSRASACACYGRAMAKRASRADATDTRLVYSTGGEAPAERGAAPARPKPRAARPPRRRRQGHPPAPRAAPGRPRRSRPCSACRAPPTQVAALARDAASAACGAGGTVQGRRPRAAGRPARQGAQAALAERGLKARDRIDAMPSLSSPSATDLLAGKTTVITGGGTGLGRSMALRMAGLGARVAVLGRRPEPLEETVAAIRERRRHGGRGALRHPRPGGGRARPSTRRVASSARRTSSSTTRPATSCAASEDLSPERLQLRRADRPLRHLPLHARARPAPHRRASRRARSSRSSRTTRRPAPRSCCPPRWPRRACWR